MYGTLIDMKQFVRAAEVAKERQLGQDNVQAAVNAGRDFYVTGGHLKNLTVLGKEFPEEIKISDDDMRECVENSYAKHTNSGRPDRAANVVKNYWPAEDPRKAELIYSAVNPIIELAIAENNLMTALKYAREYWKYGFADKAKEISDLIDRERGPNGESWPAFKERMNQKQQKQLASSQTASGLPSEEEERTREDLVRAQRTLQALYHRGNPPGYLGKVRGVLIKNTPDGRRDVPTSLVPKNNALEGRRMVAEAIEKLGLGDVLRDLKQHRKVEQSVMYAAQRKREEGYDLLEIFAYRDVLLCALSLLDNVPRAVSLPNDIKDAIGSYIASSSVS